eukprot:766638-Hanusia_phi.AAC.3
MSGISAPSASASRAAVRASAVARSRAAEAMASSQSPESVLDQLSTMRSLATTSHPAPTAGQLLLGKHVPAPAGPACSIGRCGACGRTGWRWRTGYARGQSRGPSKHARERRAVTTPSSTSAPCTRTTAPPTPAALTPTRALSAAASQVRRRLREEQPQGADEWSRVLGLRNCLRGRGRVCDADRRVRQDQGVRKHGGKLRVPVRGRQASTWTWPLIPVSAVPRASTPPGSARPPAAPAPQATTAPLTAAASPALPGPPRPQGASLLRTARASTVRERAMSPRTCRRVSDEGRAGFSGNISSARDSCRPVFSNIEEQSRWFRLGASGMSCAQTCAAEGKTCVSSAINQIDNEEAMRSAVRAASMASDQRIRGAMKEPQQRPAGLHLRMSAGAHEGGGDRLQDLTANSGHVRRRRIVEHGATKFPLVPQSGPDAGRTCCNIRQDFYVDLPVELQNSRMIMVSVTVEDADWSWFYYRGWMQIGGKQSTLYAYLNPNGNREMYLNSVYFMAEVPLQDALTSSGQIGPITIVYDSVSNSANNGRSSWRIAIGEMKETEEPLRVRSDGKLKYVNGSIHDAVYFPPMSIPGPVFTLCSISRYNGDRRYQILGASDDLFVHGHWDGGSQQVYYEGTWELQEDLRPSANMWVVLCGQNYQEGKFFLNGKEYDRSAGSLPDSLQLAINDPTYFNELRYSDWALSEVAIWSGALREEEMKAVSDHFMKKLSDGSGAVYNQTLNVACSLLDVANNQIAPYVAAEGCFFRSSQTKSSCDASFHGTSRLCVCSAPCLENFYGRDCTCLVLMSDAAALAGQADECFRCPFFSHSQPGSSSVRDCSCEQGSIAAAAGLARHQRV